MNFQSFQSFSGMQNEIQENCMDMPSEQFPIANDYSNSCSSTSSAMNCDVIDYGYMSNISNDGLIDGYNAQYNTSSDHQLQLDQRSDYSLTTHPENVRQGDYNSDSADSFSFYSPSNIRDNMGAASMNYGTSEDRSVLCGEAEYGGRSSSGAGSSSHEEGLPCLVPEGGLRTSRIAYRELTDEMKIKHTKYLQNERAKKYREKNYQMLKQTEDELSKLQLQNETLHTQYEHLKQKKDKILSLLPDPMHYSHDQESHGANNFADHFSMSTHASQISLQKVPQSSDTSSHSAKEEDIVIKCNCREGIKCQTNKCSCYKRYRACNSRCHKGQPCENL